MLRLNIRLQNSPLLMKTYTDVMDGASMVESEYEDKQIGKRPRVEGDLACFHCGVIDHFVRACLFRMAVGIVFLLTREDVRISHDGELDMLMLLVFQGIHRFW